MNILVLNCGSSSAKFAVIDATTGDERVSGIAQRLNSGEASLDWKLDGHKHTRALPGAGHDRCLRAAVEVLGELGLLAGLAGVGHRVVHGGSRFSASIRITPEVVSEVEACIPLGPLHNPPNLLGISIAHELFPALPQVAVFDTAFHQTMPPRAYTYAVPHAWLEEHEVRRYGFHGTSHRFVAEAAVAALGLDPTDHALVTAHLGNGASATAVRDGRSVDTTMGLTPLEGLVMGTRSGSVDPAIIGHMARALDVAPTQILDALNKQSGLLGVSGLSNDLRTLEEAAGRGHARARLAIDVFSYVLAKAIAALVVPLGRLDAVVFTGGIGENSSLVRAQVLTQLAFLGLDLDAEANARCVRGVSGRITTSTRPQAVVVPTNEELLIARDTAALIS
ncbi:MAG: acetate kinase [Deltaproteobacteria bacterium HGW-Deltaproteobacteria-14]|jgi:acetate kinase|nr:MAG: acetate kinase [Deltaproteobacteria bacterium HGW-Deltaproteobacteria-14]